MYQYFISQRHKFGLENRQSKIRRSKECLFRRPKLCRNHKNCIFYKLNCCAYRHDEEISFKEANYDRDTIQAGTELGQSQVIFKLAIH